jgi:hypothetical protein
MFWIRTAVESSDLIYFSSSLNSSISGFIGILQKLHNEELHESYSSPSISRMIKSRRIILAGHIARMGENRNAYRIFVGKPN